MKFRSLFATIVVALLALLLAPVEGRAQNLLLGLNANAIGQGDSTPVTMWDNGYGSATQANATWQPTFIQSSAFMNGNAAVRFDDGGEPNGDGMSTSVSGLGTDYTIMALYAHRRTGTNAARVVQGGNGTRNAGGGASGNNWLIGPYNGQHQLYDGAFISGGVTTTDPVIATAVGSGAVNNEFYLDGIFQGSNGNNNQPNFVGLGTEGAWAESADSDLGAVLVFDAPLSIDQRVGVEFILASEFDLSGFSATPEQIAAGRLVLDGFLAPATVPEPTSIAIWLLAGALGVAGYRTLRRRNAT